jgi:hypothetical protein
MLWLLLAGVAGLVVLRIARRRRSQVTIAPSEAISTINVAMSKRNSAQIRAALKAATSALR